MNQIKIGKFIQEKRKEIGLTQSELAEKLYVTDRAVSKWENGVCIPDASNVMELCKLLNITINDLYSGKVVDMKDKEKILEENLLEMAKIKEEKDKQLLALEVVIGAISSISFLVLIFIASFLDLSSWLRVTLIVVGSIIFSYGVSNAIKIEQTAGYYECENCHHKYIPTYNSVLFAIHKGRTRKMKCPKCNKKTWNKKVLTK